MRDSNRTPIYVRADPESRNTRAMNDPKTRAKKDQHANTQHSDRQGSLPPRDPVLVLCSPDATAAFQHLALTGGNRRSTRTRSPSMQTAPLPPSHQQKIHQTRSCLAEGFRAIHSSTPHRISSTSHIHSPARYRRTRRTSCRSTTTERGGLRSYSESTSTRCCLVSTAASTPMRSTAASLPTTELTLSTAPNRNAFGDLRRTLTATLVAVPLDVTYFATLMACQPLGRQLFFLARP